jgi:hypothetical protein
LDVATAEFTPGLQKIPFDRRTISMGGPSGKRGQMLVERQPEWGRIVEVLALRQLLPTSDPHPPTPENALFSAASLPGLEINMRRIKNLSDRPDSFPVV